MHGRWTALALGLITACGPLDGDTGGVDGGGEVVLRPAPEVVDLGTVYAGETAEGEFSIGNRGEGAALVKLSIEGEHAAAWTVAPPNADIPAGKHANFVATVSPEGWADHSVVIVVAEGDDARALELPATVRVDVSD